MAKTKVIAIANQKGGVGKTTTTANLGYALSQLNKKVLLIDFDSQVSLTNYLNVGLNNESYYGISEMMIMELRASEGDPISEEEDEKLASLDFYNDEDFAKLCELCICKPKYTVNQAKVIDGKKQVVTVDEEFGFDLLPAHLLLSDYELQLASGNVSGNRLRNVIDRIINWKEYDYILIDCNPSLGVMTMNALFAARDGVIVPTNLDIISTRGVSTFVNRVGEVQQVLKDAGIIHMGVIGILLNLYSSRRTVDNMIQENLEMFYPFEIFNAKIPESVDAKRAALAGYTYSQTNKKADEQYKLLAKELEKKLEKMEHEGQKIQFLEENRKFNGVIRDEQ